MQGWRISMEDAHTAILDLQNTDDHKKTAKEERLSFFAVFDGHGGHRVALFSGDNVYKILAKQAAFEDGNYEQALKDSFLATDRAILQGIRYFFLRWNESTVLGAGSGLGAWRLTVTSTR